MAQRFDYELEAELEAVAGEMESELEQPGLIPVGKYTHNSKEVVTHTTKPAPSDVVSMLALVWPQLNNEGARMLASQFMVETGGGKYCFNWNLGNVKAGSEQPHMYLRNVWECDNASAAAAKVAQANGLARIATAEEIANHGWKCPAAVIVFDPPHPQCRFRAYSSLRDGAQRWVGVHQRIARLYAAYIPALNAGDVGTVAHLLKSARYFSASEASYASAMTRQKSAIDRSLGAA